MAPNPSPFTLYGTGTFIVGKNQLCIIDPGPKIESHIKNILKAVGKNLVSHILITHTHADHSPAASVLKNITGARTYAFDSYPKGIEGSRFEEAHDKEFMPDERLKDNETVSSKEWTIRAIHPWSYLKPFMLFFRRGKSTFHWRSCDGLGYDCYSSS